VYAIFEDGGRQYKVAPGDRVYVDLRELAEGQSTLEFDHVLMVGEGSEAAIGQPLVAGAKVLAQIDATDVKGEKIDIVKFRRRKNYRRKTGHRQRHMQVTITDIVAR